MKSSIGMKSYQKSLYYFLLVFFAIIIIVPFFIMVMTSLKTSSEIQSGVFSLFPHEWRFDNYKLALESTTWGRFFFNTAYVTCLSVLISLVINSMAGYAFSRLIFKGRDFLFVLALVGMMIPTQVTMLPNFVLMRYIPLAGGNNILGQGGTGLINTYAGMIAPYIAGAFGVFLFRQFFMNFPKSLDDAAKIDGLSKWGTFTRIYIPLSKPVFATLIVLKTTTTWNEYTWPLIITSSKKMWTVQLALSVFKDEFITQWNLLMASTTLIMLPLIILYLLMQKYFIEGIVTTGIKG
ncbi:carbohydrate ABC transporter permease [Ruminiclostridium cellobioparum]|uniref:ABC-type sugar transport system, permease component n=1 Tax=Ruminiclostridium cellobioparum subsp. termitidis CT1112 TaxID=1195236 RepID=S0FHV0_RUMCE|nr:carbohydrate ABC transporter permease [Ruminiclostridium cellobioparum]EMS71122.1 ABC-type sugar transport system, permease component [Ruminiclostridium cellobioparum subsp. termitidis CT1112]